VRGNLFRDARLTKDANSHQVRELHGQVGEEPGGLTAKREKCNAYAIRGERRDAASRMVPDVEGWHGLSAG